MGRRECNSLAATWREAFLNLKGQEHPRCEVLGPVAESNLQFEGGFKTMELNIAIELYPILSFLQLFENVCTTVISCKSCQQTRGPIQPAEHWCDSLSITIRLIPAQDQTSSAAGEDMRSEYEYRGKEIRSRSSSQLQGPESPSATACSCAWSRVPPQRWPPTAYPSIQPPN
jgi:hypothetical protein